jgi:threonylcarbamoyladenosine tRNA methylthiotransferase MtaB
VGAADRGLDQPLRVSFTNVGCKLNQHELETLQNGFDRRGHTVVGDGDADVCVVNTCTVTGSGDADSRKAVRRARRRNPGATVVATGCYAQRRPLELTAAGAHLVLGNDRKADLLQLVEGYLAGDEELPPPEAVEAPVGRFLEIEGAVARGRTRGTLKIQDGCDEHCTYCIIPAVRGKGISRPAGEVVNQARKMVEAGYRELAITGVHTGSYGGDSGRPSTLVPLLKELDCIDGLERVRLNSVEPAYVSETLIDHAASSAKFCRHFHIPLQSGDDAVLRRMGRRYRRRDYAAMIERIHSVIPDCAIGADVMVGFPGEERVHFDNTCSLLRDLPVSYLHVFPYSLRTETPAERLAGHVSRGEKSERARELIALGNEKRMRFHRHFVGCRVYPLVEDRRDRVSGLPLGLTDNYVKVAIDSGGDLAPGSIVAADVTRAREDMVYGTAAGAGT